MYIHEMQAFFIGILHIYRILP